jgi:hypothetical protein
MDERDYKAMNKEKLNIEFCPKTYFANERFANEYIAKLKATSERIKKPVRSYLCERCLNWHLTSLTQNQSDILQIRNKELREKNLLIANMQREIKALKKLKNIK